MSTKKGAAKLAISRTAKRSRSKSALPKLKWSKYEWKGEATLPAWRGLACEAIEGVLSYIFGTLNKHRVSATTDTKNKAAQKLFQRLDFRQEAHLVEHVWFKGAWGSEYLFAMLQREWKMRPAPDSGTSPTA